MLSCLSVSDMPLVSWYLPANHVLLSKLSNVQQENRCVTQNLDIKKPAEAGFFRFAL
jgi:hypothetical protein